VNCPGSSPDIDPPMMMLAHSDSQQARLRALQSYGIIDTEAEAAFDDLAILAARICNVPLAAVSFVLEVRQWFKASIGFGVRETPLTHSFCAHAVEYNAIFIVTDASNDSRFSDNPLVTGEFGVRFYAGVPVRSHDGIAMGTLCVVGREPRPSGLSSFEVESLTMLARQVEMQLELRRRINEAQRANEMQAQLTEKLNWVANHDRLTELPNRALFQQQLKSAIANSRINQSKTVVMLIDVDHFKQVNDSHGHDAGDALLCAIARRLTSIIGTIGTVARIGGDEFAVILPDIVARSDLDLLITGGLDSLRKPFDHNGRYVECRASVGLAIFPDHANSEEQLIKNADLALADAKMAGRNCAKLFRPALAKEFDTVTAMLESARHAIDHSLIRPFYQPKLSLNTGQIKGFEALLRWKNATGAIELPSSIAPAFEDRELAVAISDRMIDCILSDMRDWCAAGVDFDHVAINTAAADFASNEFGERLLEKISQYGVLPTMIEIEVTESVILSRGGEQVHRALSLLRKNGVRVALDDFGTGYASLTSLKQFPITTLKIDRSFVSGLCTNVDDEAIVAALTTIGQRLDIETVAEGIESWDQVKKLTQLGATMGQGFVFSPAVPGEQVPFFCTRGHLKFASHNRLTGWQKQPSIFRPLTAAAV
jgi:diguanylate cyclase (GGDEF)-like protein